MRIIIVLTISLFLSQTCLGQKYFDTNYSGITTDTSGYLNLFYDSVDNHFYAVLITVNRDGQPNSLLETQNYYNIKYDTAGNILGHKKYELGIEDTIFHVQKILRYRDTLRCFGMVYFDSSRQFIFSGNLKPDMSVDLIAHYAYPKNDSNFTEIGAVDTTSDKFILFPNRRSNYGDPAFGYAYYTPYVLELSKTNFDSIKLHQIYSANSPDLPAKTVSAFYLNNNLRTTMEFKNDSNASFNPAYFNEKYEFCRFDTNYTYNSSQNIRINDFSLFDKNGDYYWIYLTSGYDLFSLPISNTKVAVTIPVIWKSCVSCGTQFATMVGMIDPINDTFINFKLLPIYNPIDSFFSAQYNAFDRSMTYDNISKKIYTYSCEFFVGANRSVPYITCLDTNLNIKWQHFNLKTGYAVRLYSGLHTSNGKIVISYTETPFNGGKASPVIYMIDSSMGAVATTDIHNKLGAVRVYPNPSSGEYSFQFDNFFNGQLLVYSIDGRLVHTSNINGSTAKINISNLAQGEYIWKLIDKNKQAVLSNIIIKE